MKTPSCVAGKAGEITQVKVYTLGVIHFLLAPAKMKWRGGIGM